MWPVKFSLISSQGKVFTSVQMSWDSRRGVDLLMVLIVHRLKSYCGLLRTVGRELKEPCYLESLTFWTRARSSPLTHLQVLLKRVVIGLLLGRCGAFKDNISNVLTTWLAPFFSLSLIYTRHWLLTESIVLKWILLLFVIHPNYRCAVLDGKVG